LILSVRCNGRHLVSTLFTNSWKRWCLKDITTFEKEYIFLTSLFTSHWRITSTLRSALPTTESRLVALCLSLVSSAWQWPFSLIVEIVPESPVLGYGMDETSNQEDAALSLSVGGPLRRVRDPGGLESEGLTFRSGSILRGRTPHTSQMKVVRP